MKDPSAPRSSVELSRNCFFVIWKIEALPIERGTIAYQSLRADCLEQLVLLFDLGGAERGLLLEGGHHGTLLLPHLPQVLSALLTRHPD